jgi:C4-dicarboxylate transporter DctM subunit
MDQILIGVIGIITLVILILAGLHVGLVLTLVGGLGMMIFLGPKGGLHILASTPFAIASTYDLTPLPLFFLMGAFATSGGLGALAYDTMNKWVGRFRGGLAVATTFACALFGLASGSSMATASIFTKVALPEMLKRNYSKELAIGSIAAAGTFAVMIPPSGPLILYGIFTEVSIGQLFMAGVVPGVLTALVYAFLILFRSWRNPKLAPEISEYYDLRTKIVSLLYTWPILLLGFLVLGGIFFGWFTPNEAGGIGAFGALLIAIAYKGFRGADVPGGLVNCMIITGMIFLIIIGAVMFGRFLSVSQIPVQLSTFASSLPVPRIAILLILIVIYVIFGMLLDVVAILAITLPVVFPVILELGYDPVWFGIIVVKVSEIGQVTPPVGMNVYVAVGSAEGQVTLAETFRGITPFILCDLVVLAILLAIPQIALFLPGLMFQQ